MEPILSPLARLTANDTVEAPRHRSELGGRPHTPTPEERVYLLQVYETLQFKIETLCKNTGLKRSALYSNPTLAREERDALAVARGGLCSPLLKQCSRLLKLTFGRRSDQPVGVLVDSAAS